MPAFRAAAAISIVAGRKHGKSDAFLISGTLVESQHFTLNSAGSYASCDESQRSVTSSASPFRRA